MKKTGNTNKTIITHWLRAVVGFCFVGLVLVGLAHQVEAAVIAQYTGGIVVYGDSATGTPKYKVFDDTAGFGSEQSATAVGSTTIEWIRVAASPTRDEWIIVTRDAADIIVSQVCTGVDGGVSCGATTTVTATAGTHGLRNFDVAYEQTSGDALIVYGTATADELRKIEWNGTSWTGDASITTTRTSGTVEWVELTSRPASDQIAIGYSDSNDDVSAYRWSGTAAGDEATAVITASGSTADVRKFDVSFEGTSGDMIVAAPLAGAGTTALGHMTSAGTWTIVANTEPDNITSFIDLQEVGSDDDVAMIAQGTTTANNPTEGYELNGATPNTTTTGMVDSTVAADTTTLNWIANYMPVSVAYLSSTYYAVGIFSDVTGADDINWWTMNSAGVWVLQADNTRTRGTVRFTDIFDYPNANKVLLFSSDANSDLWADTWDGAATGTTVWSDRTSGGAVETILSASSTDVYDFAFRLSAVPQAISGVLYESDRTTTAAAGYTIKLAVGTSSTPGVYTATTTSGGAWTFDSINITTATTGTPYVIWLDATSTKATTLLSGNASSSAGGIHLYQGHLVVNGSTTASVMNLANFSVYDSTDDSDVLMTVGATTATTTGSFFIRQGVFTPTATFTIFGDYTNNGTFTNNSGTLNFFSTTSEQMISGNLTGSSALYNLSFTGSTSSEPTGLEAHWTFDNDDMVFISSTTGTSTDISGNGNHGELLNMSSSSVVTAQVNEGLSFDGVNDYISIPVGSINSLTTPSACAWVKPRTGPGTGYPPIFTTYDANSGWDMYLIDAAGTYGFGTSYYTGSAFVYKEKLGMAPVDTWTHVCAVQDGGTDYTNLHLYVNGVDVGSDYVDGSGARASDSDNGAHIGANYSGTTPITATIDELRVYDHPLTTQEIEDIYTGGAKAKQIVGNASTTGLTINQGTLVATSTISIAGNYTNNGTFTTGPGTTTFSGTSNQTATGTMTGTSAFRNLAFTGAGIKTFGANASTTNLTAESGSGDILMPPALTVAGTYITNNSTTTHAGGQWIGRSVSDDNESWNDITFGNGMFVAVSESGVRLMTSYDGIEWYDQTVGGDDDSWSSVTFGGGVFVAVGYSGDHRVATSSDGITWGVASAAGNDDLWTGVTYGNGLFVAVGASPGTDRIMTSRDGSTWVVQSVLSANDSWYGVTYGNGLFVAVGDSTGLGNSIMTSTDGFAWTPQSAAGDDDNWYGVAYGNGIFVIVGASGGGDPVITSPDGATWTVRSAADDNDDWVGITYGNGLFAAVSPSGDHRLITSANGINWTPYTVPGTEAWYGVAYGNNTFVAVSNSGSGESFMTSKDTTLYVASSSAQTLSGNLAGASQLRDVQFTGAGSKTISSNASTTNFTINTSATVVTGSSVSIAGNYTNDGTLTAGPGTTTFSGAIDQVATGTMTGTSAFRNLSFKGSGAKIFFTNASTTNFTTESGSGEVVTPAALTVAGSYTVNNDKVAQAATLLTFQSASDDDDAWNGVTYGNGTFVAVGEGQGGSSGDMVITSSDSVTWTAQSAAGNNDFWTDVTYGNGLFVAVGDGDATDDHVMTSPNGSAWTIRTAAGGNDFWKAVTYGNGLFVAVGDAAGSEDAVMTSPDGVNWTVQSAAGNDDSWYGVTYGNGLFVAVGDATGAGDPVMTSPDGVNWTAYSAAGNDDTWYGVTYGNGLFVAVGNGTGGGVGDRVMTSPDGVNWTVRYTPGHFEGWVSVTYGNGLFVAAGVGFGSGFGYYGSATSPDGVNWTSRLYSPGMYSDVTYGNNTFVFVSNIILGVATSKDTTLYMASSSAQTLSGNLSGATQLRDVVLTGTGAKTFSNNASTTNLMVGSSASVNLPSAISIAGNYTNSGSVEAGSGTVYLNGANPQTLSGSMTTTNAFNNLVVENNSRVASTSFTGALTVDGTLTAEGSTYIALLSGATSTVANLTLQGSSTAPVAFGATATGTQAKFVLTGTPTVTYARITDNNACGSTGGTIDVSSGNNTDGGNTNCWSFIAAPGTANVALDTNLHFYLGQATTTVGTITVTDDTTPTITSANDIRLKIATTTTNFRFDVGVTTLSFGGTASGKVSNPVSYEDGGATLVIPVSSDFAGDDTLTIGGIAFGAFAAVSSDTSQLTIHTDGNSLGAAAASSTETIIVTGLLTVSEHDAGQVENEFSWQNRTETSFFAFKLAPTGETATITDMVITLSGINSITSDDISNFKLYRDSNSDGVMDGGDLLIDSSGVLTINGQNGAVTFSTDFAATTSYNYIMIADTTTVPPGGAAVFKLLANGVTGLGLTSQYQSYVQSTVSDIQHIRNVSGGSGGGGNSDRIGGDAPAGAGTVTGGGTSGGGEAGGAAEGENLAGDPDYYRPTDIGAPSEWTNGANAYASDGSYATAASNGFRQTYINFGFGIPTNNTIQGIGVKLDASGSTAAGTIDVALSWDGGSSYTTAKATPTLSGSDIVYTVGGPSDIWGRAWTAGEFSNANFRLRVTAAPSSNTVRIDALEIRVYHQASGGGSGGGGGI
jgi:Concanavalin A-like lectin/glucanases superfamily